MAASGGVCSASRRKNALWGSWEPVQGVHGIRARSVASMHLRCTTEIQYSVGFPRKERRKLLNLL